MKDEEVKPTPATIESKKATPYAVKSGTPDFLQVKDVDTATRTVTGLYNTSYFFDSDQDVVLPGAMLKSINDRGPASTATQKIKHLMFHDWTKLPGRIEVLEERKVDIGGKTVQGVYFETKMAGTTLGNDALISYQEGVYDNHSIGYQYMVGEYIDMDSDKWDQTLQLLLNPDEAQKAGYMFLWSELRQYEGSTVAFGANALTPYLGVKSKNPALLQMKLNERIEILRKQVASGKQSDDLLQSFDMQLLQIEQLTNELFAQQPSSAKDTIVTDGRQKNDTTVPTINFGALRFK